MSIKFINKLLIIILTCTNVQASSVYKTETYFNLRDLMQSATFSFENNEIIATFANTNNNDNTSFKNVKSFSYTINKNYTDILTNNKNSIYNSNCHKSNICDKYDQAILLIMQQKILSLLNYKLNNNLDLNEAEQNNFDQFNSIKTNNLGNDKKIHIKKQYKFASYNLLKKQCDNILPHEITTLHNDFINICNSCKVDNFIEQLKLDLYRQIISMNNTCSYKYNDALKLVYKCYISYLYHK